MESKILGSRYELLEQVGMGGMAIVYKAKDKMLNRFVAVKILREEFKENEDFIHRFKIESQAAASLSHQNIVQIYDVGEEDGMHYIVMEYLEGQTLKKYISDCGGKLSRREAINFSMQICRALEHAHSKYVVHRDIKPQNIVITESGKLKVADFGIARAVNNNTTVNDKSSMAVGSAHYLSPEQARGGYTDQHSDIYSLGVVMYEMFCGKLPFDAEESISVVMQHLHEEPTPPCEVNSDLPLGIEAIILKAMKKEQRLRYGGATEILEDLVLVYQNPSVDVSMLNASTEDSSLPRDKKPQPKGHNQSRRKKKKNKLNKPLLVLLGIFTAAVIALVVLLANILFPNTGKEVEVPTLLGMTFEEASLEAERSSGGKVDFTVIESHYEYSDNLRNTIISQSPEGGGMVKSSREIKVVISKGPVLLELDDYTGRDFEKVKEELEALGIKVEKILEADSYEEGKIFKQNPKEGTQRGEEEIVTLYVSEGAKNTIVPKVLGLSAEEATDKIEKNELVVGSITEEQNSEYQKGEICYQSVKENERVPVGTVINLKISTGKKDTENENSADPSENMPKPQKKKSVNLTLSGLPKNRETVTIRLVLDGGTFYEKDFPTNTGSVTIPIETDRSLSLDVYYDGTYITTKEVKY